MSYIETPPTPLQTPNAQAFIDPVTRLVYCKYENVVTPVETNAVYDWILAGINDFHVPDFRGTIFDFREVTSFEIGNTPIAVRASSSVNTAYDLSMYPVALVVRTLRQEVKVRTSLMGNDGARKYVAHSQDNALAFINEWNYQHRRTFDMDENLLTAWPENRYK